MVHWKSYVPLPSTQEESEVGCRWPVAQSLNHRNGWISEDFQPASLAESMCFRFSEGLRERWGVSSRKHTCSQSLVNTCKHIPTLTGTYHTHTHMHVCVRKQIRVSKIPPVECYKAFGNGSCGRNSERLPDKGIGQGCWSWVSSLMGAA